MRVFPDCLSLGSEHRHGWCLSLGHPSILLLGSRGEAAVSALTGWCAPPHVP